MYVKTNQGGKNMDTLISYLPIIAPILIIQLILLIVSFIDLVKIEKTNGPKWLWVMIILFINIIGPILYFVIGRRSN